MQVTLRRLLSVRCGKHFKLTGSWSRRGSDILRICKLCFLIAREVRVVFKYNDGVLDATIELPNCTSGEFDWCDQKLPLKAPSEEMRL